MDFSIYLRYCSAACIYFSFRWGPFVYSLGIVQWDSIRRDHPGYSGRVFGSGPVNQWVLYWLLTRIKRFYCSLHTTRVIESNRAIYFEDDTSTSKGPREIMFKEHLVFIPMSIASAPITSSVVD